MSRCPEEDRALVALMVAGHSHSAETFDSRFRPYLMRFVRGRVPPDHEPDLVQDVLLAAFTQISAGKFSGTSGLNTWVIGILKHKVADFWEHRERESKAIVSVSRAPETSTDLGIEALPDAHGRNPDLAIEIEQLLVQLPKIHRVALILKLREGWSTDHISAAMSLPSGTVSRLIWEAKRMLQHLRPPLKELPPKADK